LSQLGDALRQMRNAAGLTQRGLAADLGWVWSKVSKLETGAQLPTEEDIRAWTIRAGQPDKTEELLDLLEDAKTIRHDARRRAGRSQAGRQVTMYQRIEAASLIRDVEPMAITGILQTAGYARSTQEQVAAVFGAGDIDQAVEDRMRQQDLLYERDRDGNPKRRFEFITTEAALTMPPCPVPVMLGQLTKLQSLLDLDNVTFAVIPMGVELTIAPFFGFQIADGIVYVEDYSGSDEHRDEKTVETFSKIFGLLMGEAVKGEDARRLIASAAARLREGT
jgi:transcriptional regulator with XRE-family HTH domain